MPDFKDLKLLRLSQINVICLRSGAESPFLKIANKDIFRLDLYRIKYYASECMQIPKLIDMKLLRGS